MINSHKVTKHACTSSWLPLAHSIHHTYHQVTVMKNNKRNKGYKQLIYIYISHVNGTQTVPDISPLMPMHQDPLLVVALGHLYLMSLMSASYLAMILPAGCLTASLPAAWSITRFGLAPSGNMLLILLCIVGISAPGYAKHVAFTPRVRSLGPSPRTNEVPIIIVSGSRYRFEMGSSAGLADDSSCWLVEAWAAAPISTTGMGCAAAVGRDHVVGSGGGVALGPVSI